MGKYTKIYVCFGGDVSSDVAESLAAKLEISGATVGKISMDNSKAIKSLVEEPASTLAIFVCQTIENAQPPEIAGTCVRFFKRKTHPEDMLKDKFEYTVLGLGDSNLLLDRQTTTANDCNQVAQDLDARLSALGGSRGYKMGLGDERTGFTEVEPWIEGLMQAL
jgi:sulfite reductase alpha subunit-like flavoprotein